MTIAKSKEKENPLTVAFMIVLTALVVGLLAYEQVNNYINNQERFEVQHRIQLYKEMVNMQNQIKKAQEEKAAQEYIQALQLKEQQIEKEFIESKDEQYYADLDELAHLIWAEVGDAGETAMYYCGSVVMNRVNDDGYPNSIHKVIYQSGQYQVTWNGAMNKEPPDVAYEIAADLLQEGSIIPSNVVYQAGFEQGSGVFAGPEDIGGTDYYCYK